MSLPVGQEDERVEMLHATALLLFFASAENRPTIAVVPPAPIDHAETWLSFAVGDNLAAGLLSYSRKERKTSKWVYPVNVFSYRQVFSAARAERVNPRQPMTDTEIERLARQLGARYVFTGSYRVRGRKRSRVLLKWRVHDMQRERQQREQKVTTNIRTLAARTERLVRSVLRAIGERGKPPPRRGKRPSLRALKDYARGLEILSGQSMDPSSQVVLPGEELEKAHLLFRWASSASPDFIPAWAARGLTSAMLGDLPRAEGEVRRAATETARFDPINALGLYYIRFRQGRRREAIAVLESALTTQPGFLGALGYLGSAYLRAEQPDHAVTVFGEYARRVPSSPWARVMYARALASKGEHEQAMTMTQQVLASFPNSAMVLTNHAARQAQAEKYQEAEETLTQGLLDHPGHPGLLTIMSYVKLKLGAASEALALAQQAVDQIGDGRGVSMAGYAHANLGHALALLGKREQALTAFENAARLGVSTEDRRRLLEDKRLEPLMQDPGNPLASDAPPPPPPPPPPLADAVVKELEAERSPDDGKVAEDAWQEESSFSKEDDWAEQPPKAQSGTGANVVEPAAP